MSKQFKITKTVPGNVAFTLHPVSHPEMGRLIRLTDQSPAQVVPQDWALGIFWNDGIYNLFKKGYITVSDTEELTKAAYDAGVYFDEHLDFVPTKEDYATDILAVLQTGNREKITNLIQEQGKEKVFAIVTAHKDTLNYNVIRMLENMFNIQLTVDGE